MDLPQTVSEPIEDTEDRDPIIVSVDREGQYFVSLGGDETR